jgi:hypothetical protein
MRRLAFALGVIASIALAGPGAEARASCRSFHIAPTELTHRAPEAGLVSHMAVLRRPQQPDDLPSHDLKHFPYRFLAVDYVRKVAQVGSTSYYLIPGSPTFMHLSRRCLRRLSPHRRRVEQRIEREQRARSRVIGLGQFEFGRIGGAGSCCADLDALLANRTIQTTGSGHSVVTGLVPDGVASVTLRWHRGPSERNATVVNNFWRARVPLSAPRAFPHSTIWRDAGGHLVKSFREPGGR